MKVIAIFALMLSAGTAAWPILQDKDLPVTFAHTCNTPCFRLVGSEKPLDYDVVRYDIARALDAFSHHGPIRAAGACAVLKSTVLRIRDDVDSWGDDVYSGDLTGNCREVSGMFHPRDNYVEVTRSMHSLAHEMLHVYEYKSGLVEEPGEFPGSWETNVDYLRLFQEYQETEIGLDGSISVPAEDEP